MSVQKTSSLGVCSLCRKRPIWICVHCAENVQSGCVFIVQKTSSLDVRSLCKKRPVQSGCVFTVQKTSNLGVCSLCRKHPIWMCVHCAENVHCVFTVQKMSNLGVCSLCVHCICAENIQPGCLREEGAAGLHPGRDSTPFQVPHPHRGHLQKH